MKLDLTPYQAPRRIITGWQADVTNGPWAVASFYGTNCDDAEMLRAIFLTAMKAEFNAVRGQEFVNIPIIAR